MNNQFDFGFDDTPDQQPSKVVAPKTKLARAVKVADAVPANDVAAIPDLSAVSAAPTEVAVSDVPASDMEVLARQLETHPDYRVLRRLVPAQTFARKPLGPTRRVVILDTETTGLDVTKEQIIELALVCVDVCTVSGLPCGDVEVFDELEDPGKPISAEIEQLTGITDAMVQGKRLNEARIAELIAHADLVVAHNAAFDRPFVEARLPGFARLPWACSFADIDWKAAGQSSAKLENLTLKLGWFYDAHRAETDCHALLTVLCSEPQAGLGTGLARLMTAATQTAFRLQATGAPFETKDLLKARGYRWNNEQRVWGTRLSGQESLEAELAWLKANVYKGRNARVQLETLQADTLYSLRSGEVESLMVEG
jgi:DNA polymerase-3 subunit epsilon